MKSYTKKTLVILLFLTLMGGWSLYIDKVFYDRMTTDIENLSKQPRRIRPRGRTAARSHVIFQPG